MTTYLDRLIASGCLQHQSYDDMFARADFLVRNPEPYSQKTRSTKTVRRRCDCSGCGCEVMGSYMDGPGSWGGHSTTTAATYGVIYQIPRSEAEAGDFYGDCGPGSAETANGHIGWIEKFLPGGSIYGVDHGSGTGPRRMTRTWGNFEAWRYAFAMDATPPLLGVNGLVLKLDSYGGPAMDVQRAINNWAGKTILTIDGVLGPISIGEVTTFQRGHHLEPDGIIGPDTSAKLLTYLDETPVPPVPVPLFTEAQELRIAQLARQSIKLAL